MNEEIEQKQLPGPIQSPFHAESQLPLTVSAALAMQVAAEFQQQGLPGTELEPRSSLLQPIPDADQLSFQFININAYVLNDPSSPPLKVLTSSVKYAAPQMNQILHGINGSVMPGEILALMGPSGSGKTTMLSVLSGRAAKNLMVSGQSLCNDRPLTKPQKRRIGFVLQDDILYESLTVQETLMYAALLRLPKDMSYAGKLERVDRVIGALGLAKCKDTIIGGFFRRGVSGGERKRASIGVELLTNPSIIMLDEPTSGLDSTTSFQLLTTLKQLAGAGRAIVTTIHQPSSRLYLLLDKLLLLADGHTLYYGNAQKVVEWFQHLGFTMPYGMNVADFVLDLAMGQVMQDGHAGLTGPDSVKAMYTAYDRFYTTQGTNKAAAALGFYQSCDLNGVRLSQDIHAEVKQDAATNNLDVITGMSPARGVTTADVMEVMVEERSSGEDDELGPASQGNASQKRVGASYVQQVKVLWLRCLRVMSAHNLEYRSLLQVLLVALTVSVFWWQRGSKNTVAAAGDVYGLLFVQLVYCAFTTMFSALFAFSGDVKMLVKERASGMYQLSAYYLARTLADLPMECLCPSLYVIVVYFTGHLRLSADAFFANWLGIMLATLVAQGWGLLIGAMSSHPKTASTTAMVYVIVCMTASGFYVRHLPGWISWMKYISFLYWGFNLLLKVEFSGRSLERCLVLEGREVCESVGPDQLQGSLNMLINPNDAVWPELVFLLSSLIVLRIAVYWVLKNKTKS